MLLTNNHFTPIIGIDIHFNTLPPFNPLHPFIGLVLDPMDYLPVIGSTVHVNGFKRGVTDTTGFLIFWKHFPILTGPFALIPMMAHESLNFFGSEKAYIEGRRISPKGYMKMTCNDIGIPANLQLGTRKQGKKFSIIPELFAPTSMSLPIPTGPPVFIAPPYVPDLMGLLINMLAGLGFSVLFKGLGKLAAKSLRKFNRALKKAIGNNALSRRLCKKGFDPVNLITGEMIYEGEDFRINGALPIVWERTYSTASSFNGRLGKGVHCSYDLPLGIDHEEGIIGVTIPEGRGVSFPMIVEGKSYYHRAEKLTLSCKNGVYVLFDHESRLTYFYKMVGWNEDNLEIHKVVEIRSELGFSNYLKYDGSKDLTKIIDSEGRVIIFDLDDAGRILEANAYHNGFERHLVSYTYDEEGNMIGITDANNLSTVMEYEDGKMIKKTDRNGQAFYWKYDKQGRCIHTWGDDGILEGTLEYFPKEGYNLITNSKGITSTYYYDENNLCTEIKDALGNSVFYEYTEFNELYREIDEEGNLTGYTYDDRGNRSSVVLPDGTSTSNFYDEEDRLILANDPEGNTSIYNYDKQGRLKSTIAPDKSTTIFTYNDKNLVSEIQGRDKKVSYLSYDKDHNLVAMKMPNGEKAGWQYDTWGQNIQSTNPMGKSQQFVYDKLGRVQKIRHSDGNITDLKYNAYEEVVEAVDQHRVVKFEYTPLGSLKSREENGTRVSFKYNTEEELTSIRNERNETYRFGRNNRGEITTEVGFDGLRRLYDRDRAGKVIKVNRPEDRWSEYEYDALGKIVRVEHSDQTWESYGYNKNSELIEACNNESTVLLKRDRMGRVIEEIQGRQSVYYKYDQYGRRVHISSTLGADVALAYDQVGNVNSINANNGKIEKSWTAELKHNPLGQEIERILPGGIVSTWKYSTKGMPEEHTVRINKRKVRNRIYKWDVNSRLRSMMNPLSRSTTNYHHDAFGNLAWAEYENGDLDYKLPDEVGNLYKKKDRSDRKYGKGGKLLECEKYNYIYDAEGSLVEKTGKDGVDNWTYEWFGNGMLKEVKRPDSRKVSFEYDALGRRISKSLTTEAHFQKDEITRFMWQGNVPLHEWKYDLSERPKLEVTPEGLLEWDKEEPISDDLITWIFDEGQFSPAAKLVGDEKYSIICDYLGTPVEAYDAEGEKVWDCELDIYGKVRSFSGQKNFIPFRYAGQYEDVETGLYYNRFRYYDAEMGMYVSQDPIGLAGNNPNIYAYTHDVNGWVDPFGLMAGKNFSGTAPIDLGSNYRARKDPYNFKGNADFEVHVYKVKGGKLKEVGIMNSKGGWIKKHGHKKAPNLPKSVSDKLAKICK